MLCLHRAQPSPDVRPAPESIYLLQRATQAVSQFLTVSTGGGQGIPRTALYCIKRHMRCCTNCTVLAGLGRQGQGIQNCRQQPPRRQRTCWSECDLQPWPGRSLQNTSWAGELLSGFMLPELSLPHPKAVLVFLLPYLQ